jgi:hypothetical protein
LSICLETNVAYANRIVRLCPAAAHPFARAIFPRCGASSREHKRASITRFSFLFGFKHKRASIIPTALSPAQETRGARCFDYTRPFALGPRVHARGQWRPSGPGAVAGLCAATLPQCSRPPPELRRNSGWPWTCHHCERPASSEFRRLPSDGVHRLLAFPGTVRHPKRGIISRKRDRNDELIYISDRDRPGAFILSL